MADVVSLAGDPAVRLLTLTGPGGVGKTRLAVAAAAGVTDAFSGGVVFVDLAPVSNASLVPNAIANCLGIRDIGAESMSNRVMLAIGERCLLLVLDNFEQVIVAAPWLRDLLDACPEVTLLITSRIRLRIYGEREYPVGPLPLEAAARMDEETPGAVRLFFERAQAVQPDFIPSATTTPVVAEIVRRVDGLPLVWLTTIGYHEFRLAGSILGHLNIRANSGFEAAPIDLPWIGGWTGIAFPQAPRYGEPPAPAQIWA